VRPAATGKYRPYIFYRLGVGRQNDRACEWLCGSELMPNTRKILIVDDDPELRDALTEQLSLLEEFEAGSRAHLA